VEVKIREVQIGAADRAKALPLNRASKDPAPSESKDCLLAMASRSTISPSAFRRRLGSLGTSVNRSLNFARLSLEPAFSLRTRIRWPQGTLHAKSEHFQILSYDNGVQLVAETSTGPKHRDSAAMAMGQPAAATRAIVAFGRVGHRDLVGGSCNPPRGRCIEVAVKRSLVCRVDLRCADKVVPSGSCVVTAPTEPSFTSPIFFAVSGSSCFKTKALPGKVGHQKKSG
jgi:hypothetical protein